MEEQDLCAVVQLSGTSKGRVAVGRPGGAAGGRGGRRGSKELLTELGCEELVESGGGQRSLLWRDRGGGIKVRSRELRKKQRELVQLCAYACVSESGRGLSSLSF